MIEIYENIQNTTTPILLKDLGMRYPTKKSNQKARYGSYQCQYCGKEFETQTHLIKSGNTRSCGCIKQSIVTEVNKTHGMRYHPLYNIWKCMKARCNNPKTKAYKNYGGRGIKVCERWLDVANFIEDMYPTWEEGLTLDRIDVNRDYRPENCRWVTRVIQQQNTRDLRKDNISGFRGVSWDKKCSKWLSCIWVNKKRIMLGYYENKEEAAKAYETYVRLNNLEHNFTPALIEEEVYNLINMKENR